MSLQRRIYLQRAGLLKESFGDDHDFSNLKPHHSYSTKDNHKIDVHLFNNPNGKHAIFFNKNLNGITKLVHWEHNAEMPSKNELEKLGHEEDKHENLNESKEPKERGLLGDTGGKITEHSAAIHLIHHMHQQHGTYGTTQHKDDLKPHETALKSMKNKYVTNKTQEKEFRVRQTHGKAAASSMIETLKQKHGPNVKIAAVGHTAKAGDIEKFTKGKHKDTQENPSDLTVKTYVPGNLKEEFGEGHEHHYEGFSLKSSKASKKITTKNPSIHLDGMLNHPTRSLGTEKIARDGLKEVHKKMGHGDKTAAERGRIINKVREKEGVPDRSSIEQKASKLAQPVHTATAEELHNHIHHLLTHTGDEGHRMIGNMLKKHLVPHTGMPWSKVHVMGDEEHKVKATVTPGNEHPLNKVLSNKKTKYAVSRNGATVTLHKVEKDGSHTALAHYRPKTNSNALKSDTSNYVVTPAYSH
jgi:hypothetical protein